MYYKKITTLYFKTYMYDFAVNLSRFHPLRFLLVVQTIRFAGGIADVRLNLIPSVYLYIYIYIVIYIYMYMNLFSRI